MAWIWKGAMSSTHPSLRGALVGGAATSGVIARDQLARGLRWPDDELPHGLDWTDDLPWILGLSVPDPGQPGQTLSRLAW